MGVAGVMMKRRRKSRKKEWRMGVGVGIVTGLESWDEEVEGQWWVGGLLDEL